MRIICPPGKERKEQIIERVRFITFQDRTISGPGLPWKSYLDDTLDAFYDDVKQLKGFELPELSGKF